MGKKRKNKIKSFDPVEPESNFRRFLQKKKFLLTVIGLGLIPLVWFRPFGTLITGGDFWLPLSPLNFFKSLLSAWLPRVSGGQENSLIFHLFPWVSFWAFFRFLGFSLSSIEKLWFLSLFVTAALSIFFLSQVVFGRRHGGWPGFISAALYLFNLYIMITGVVTTTLLAYCLLPLTLLIYVKGLDSEKSLRSALGLALVSVFLTSAAANPPIYSIPFLTMILYGFYYLVVIRRNFLKFLKFNFQFSIFYLLFNAWWLFPFLKGLTEQIGEVRLITAAATVGAWSNFYDLIRLLGSWAFFAGHQGFPYFPFAQSYLNPLLLLLTFLLPALVAAGIYYGRSGDYKKLNFFLFLLVFAILLSHGQADDFLGRLNGFLYRTVPFFWIYREPFAKFTALTALSYSLFLGAFFAALEARLRSPATINLLGLAILTLVLIVAWPEVSGEHYPPERGVLAPSRTKIPGYWFEMAKWFEGKEDEGRVFVLPDNPDTNRSGIPYAWGYDSADVGPHLLPVDWVERNNGFYGLPVLTDRVSKVVYRRVHETSLQPENLDSLLAVLGAGWLLQRNDVDLRRVDNRPQNYSPDFLRRFLAGQKGISLERSFGSLDIYRVASDSARPKFYVPSKATCLSGDVDHLEYPLEIEEKSRRSAIFVESEVTKDSIASSICSSDYVVPVEVFQEGQQERSEKFRSAFTLNPEANLDFPLPGGWVASSEDRRRFAFRTSRRGSYFLYFFNDAETIKHPPPKFRLERFDPNPIELGAGSLAVMKNHQSVSEAGPFDLAVGGYLLTIETPYFRNLIADGSFEKEPWPSSLSNVKPTLSDDSVGVGHSMLLGPGTSDAYAVLPTLNNNLTYEISFNYKIISGRGPFFFVWENRCDGDQPVWRKFSTDSDNSCESNFILPGLLNRSGDWQRFKSEYSPSSTVKKSGLGFVFLDEKNRAVVNDGASLIDEVIVRPKFSGNGGVALRLAGERPLSTVPQISYRRGSPTVYLVDVRDGSAPFALVFGESFDRSWKAYEINSGGSRRLIPENRHLVVNGYANAWLLKAKGNYRLEISYDPERLFRVFFALSLTSIVLAIVFLVSSFSWRRGRDV